MPLDFLLVVAGRARACLKDWTPERRDKFHESFAAS
jgi:hypothetical protein